MAFSNFVPMMFKTQSPNPSHTSSGWNCFPQHHSNRLVNGSVPPLIHFIHLISSVSHRGFPHSLRRRHCYTPSPPDVMPLCSYFKTTVRYDSNKTLYTVQIKVGPSHYSMVIWPGFPHAPFCERKQRNICWKTCCENNPTWEQHVYGCAWVRMRAVVTMERHAAWSGTHMLWAFDALKISQTKENPHNRTVAMASPTISDHCFL